MVTEYGLISKCASAEDIGGKMKMVLIETRLGREDTEEASEAQATLLPHQVALCTCARQSHCVL